MSVYRVQDHNGRGPFRPGFSQVWCDKDFAIGVWPHPTWMEEFGADLILKHRQPGEYYGSAVRTREALNGWFSSTEQRRLKHLGFKIVEMDIARVLAESTCQLVVARFVPLYVGITIHPWWPA
jgi:hypothetical protein